MWSVVKKQAWVPSGEAQEAPVSRIAPVIIHEAIREEADSVRILPHADGLRIEYLLSGTWTETMFIPKHLASPLTEQYKRMAGLPLGYRAALKGLIFIRYDEHGPIPIIEATYASDPTQPVSNPLLPGERDYEVRLFLTPSRWGERIAMQIEEVS